MSDLPLLRSYIAGSWTLPATATARFDAIDPSTEEAYAQVALCGPDDADRAVRAAHAAFPGWAALSLEARIGHVERLIAAYEARMAEMGAAITTEMGAPHDMALNAQAASGSGHLREAIAAARAFAWERPLRHGALLVHEPIGVCVCITPWNWPMNQVAAKIGPALIAGCTVVLKPSEMAPLSAALFAELADAAGLPPGVFNMVHGTGPAIGDALTGHPLVDMVSFTGSTRAGILVARSAAATVKRVAQELGGKSANVVFADSGIEAAVKRGAEHCFRNTGQSCNAPTRMLVQRSVYDEAVEVARRTAEATRVGDPRSAGNHIGPLASAAQFAKVQAMIETGVAEGARLVAGGTGRPEGFNRGFYVRPTVFADVTNAMTIAREEIFGPVLAMIPFDDEDEAVAIANDTPYGLAGYVQSGDTDRARRVARAIRAGSVHINGAGQDYDAPFGGYRQSGNGREWGEFGLIDFLEIKAINGFGTD